MTVSRNITFPDDLYKQLELTAKKKNISIAAVIKSACSEYLQKESNSNIIAWKRGLIDFESLSEADQKRAKFEMIAEKLNTKGNESLTDEEKVFIVDYISNL